MNNKTNIDKISNKFILKSLFSYLNYKDILRLVKYNKKLQNNLGFNLENYKKKSSFPKYEYIKETNTCGERRGHRREVFGNAIMTLFISYMTCILFIYSFIYTILLVSLDLFDESNTIENYDKSAVKIVKTINAYLFILDAVCLSTCFFFIFYAFKDEDLDYGIKKYVKWTLMILIDLTHLTFEGLIIWKLVLSYKIKKDDNPWFMTMDYIFIFLNFFYILYLLCFSIMYFCESGKSIHTSTNYYLTMFNDIKIFKYAVPINFHKLDKKQRKEYVLKNYINFTFQSPDSSDKHKLRNNLNKLRFENGLNKLDIFNTSQIPVYIVNEPSEMMLYPERNIFKISNKEYLLRYPIGEFINNLNNKNTELLNVLLKDNLNEIQVCTQKDLEYFHIYEKYNRTFNLKYGSDDDDNKDYNDDDYSFKLVTGRRDYIDDKKNVIKSNCKHFKE